VRRGREVGDVVEVVERKLLEPLSVARVLAAERRHTKKNGLEMPPTASEPRGRAAS